MSTMIEDAEKVLNKVHAVSYSSNPMDYVNVMSDIRVDLDRLLARLTAAKGEGDERKSLIDEFCKVRSFIRCHSTRPCKALEQFPPEKECQCALCILDIIGRSYDALLAEKARLVEAATFARDHVEELAEAWRTGALRECDSIGMTGLRSNRNWDAYIKLRAALTPAASGE